MNWTKESAFKFLQSNPDYDDFVNKGKLCLSYEFRQVKFLIYQENARASFYFAVPRIDGADYESVYNLINACEQELNTLIEDEQDKRTGIK